MKLEAHDRSKRDYFKFHRDNISKELYISGPFKTPISGTHVLALSRRLENADGSFAGVVIGALRLEYFKELFKSIALGPNDHITLSQTDGRLLMRWPYKEDLIGRNFKTAELYKQLSFLNRGYFETNTVVDGVHRLIVYSQVGNLPLVIAVGRSTADIYKTWWQQASAIGAMVIALIGVTGTLMSYLIREFRRRNRAGQDLIILATTDELTKLPNRRHFNEIIDREWKRAQRMREPISMLMLDADEFKKYNDQHGHHAGDKVLQLISRAMIDSTKRGTDFAARHGGDEFAVLLPKTPADGTLRVAKLIHQNFAALCRTHEIEGASLSIGVATLIAQPDDHFVALLVAADGALYDAKNAGRNRIAVARVQAHSDAEIEAPSMRMA